MNLDIVERQKNPLLAREELTVVVEDIESTPAREELRAKLAANLNVKEDLLVIWSIKQEYGMRKTTVKAKLYDSKEDMERIELKHQLRRNFGGPAEEKEKKPKEEVSEKKEDKDAKEKKVEEPKEKKEQATEEKEK